MAPLLDLLAARAMVAREISPPRVEWLALSEACGHVLAEPLIAPNDSPPYDKALVDGFAVNAADVIAGITEWKITEEIFAGNWPERPIASGEASRIMTGAPLPEGANAVIMVEHTQVDGATLRCAAGAPPTRPEQHLLRRAEVGRAGDLLLAAGHRLRAVDMGLAAEGGLVRVPVYARPRVDLLQTGDEVVAPDHELSRGQIRNTNGPLLAALTRPYARQLIDHGVVADQLDTLRQALAGARDADVILISGGVSQGDRDLVPLALQQSGAVCHFHRVAMKPGKPLWFGTWETRERRRLVFGLPGNPVSGLVGFLVFVAPALSAWASGPEVWTEWPGMARLTTPHAHTSPLTAFWPGALDANADLQNSTPAVRLLPWRGSADPWTLGRADGLVQFPPRPHAFQAGDLVRFWPLP